MVKYADILASNALINDTNAPRIAVFIGGTSGIGKFTIKALVSAGTSIRIYLVGRKSSEARTHTFIHELYAINPLAEIIWTEAEISLLAEIKRVCNMIKQRESRLDLLFLTAGYAPFGARKETTEGIEIAQSLECYSRILATQHLLPLLKHSESPKVVSVLAGGLERATINLDDIDLKNPSNFNFMKAQAQYAAIKTLVLDRLATENPDVTFIHSWPGWVNTGNVRRGLTDPNSLTAWIIWLVLEPLIGLLSYSDEESGQRHLYQSTSAAFGGRGVPWKTKTGTETDRSGVNSNVNVRGEPTNGGLFLVNHRCDCTPNTNVIPGLREKAQEKIWQHTQDVLRPYL